MLVDYHNHLLGHQDRAGDEADIRSFLEMAQENKIKEIAFTDHDRYYKDFNFAKITKVAAEFPDLKVLKGIEMDYHRNQEKTIEKFLKRFDLDVVIGSVHSLDGWAFDHPDYIDQYQNWDIDQLYEFYFKKINSLIRSDLFDIVGHLDLIKIFNFRPQKDILDFAAESLKLLAKHDLVMEINTNGINKKVNEFYPEKKIIKKAHELGVKITMSSDAHRADRVGENLAELRQELLEIGFSEIVCFENRKAKLKKL